jgi:FkbM family methyltransferase
LGAPVLAGLRALRHLLSKGRQVRRAASEEPRQGSASNNSGVVALPVFGGEFELSSQSSLAEALRDGNFEIYVAELLRAAISAGDHVLDVGANLGVYTVLAGKLVSPKGRVVAVEPVRSMVRLLESNIKRNGLENAAVFRGVVSDRQGSCTLEVVEGGEAYSSIGEIAHPDAPKGLRQKITAESETLDSLVARFDLRPVVIKIDTEGAEALVFSHADETLSRHRPIIFSELDQRLLAAHGASARDVAECCFSHGYEVFNSQTGEPYARERFPEDFVGDIVALPRQ